MLLFTFFLIIMFSVIKIYAHNFDKHASRIKVLNFLFRTIEKKKVFVAIPAKKTCAKFLDLT